MTKDSTVAPQAHVSSNPISSPTVNASVADTTSDASAASASASSAGTWSSRWSWPWSKGKSIGVSQTAEQGGYPTEAGTEDPEAHIMGDFKPENHDTGPVHGGK